MASTIRLYRRFYKISGFSNEQSYALIDPYYVNAKTYIKDTPNEVESVISVQKEQQGIYYAILNPNYYSYGNTYDLKWTINYLINTPTKILTTTFKINPINIANSLEFDVDDQKIEIIVLKE